MIDLPPPDPSIEFSIASTGMSKGLAQTEDEPQMLVRGEVALGSIFVAGQAKNITSSTSDGETALTVGVRRKVSSFDLAASAAWKHAINPSAGFDRNALEMTASAARGIGRLTPKLSLTWSPDDLGSTTHTLFVEAGTTFKLSDKISLLANAGWRERGGGPDYTAFNAGASWNPAKPFTLEVRYYDTDGGSEYAYRGRIVGLAKFKF